MNFRSPLRASIWLYFWLLLFEGVLRKWVFPGWSDIFFIIRDPLVVAIYCLAVAARVFPIRPAVVTIWVMAALSLAFSFASDAHFMVTLFGLRTNYLHLPLVFVMARVFDRADVIRFGRAVLFCSVPILVLMILQFRADPSDPINAVAGAGTGGQLRGSMGKIRPPGPIRFISAVVSFFALAMAFVVYGWQSRKGAIPRVLLIVASLVVVAAVPISISRSNLFGIIVVGLFGAATAARDLQRVPKMIGPLLALAVPLMLAADTIYVQAFTTRWEEARDAGGGGFSSNVIERMLGEYTQPFEIAVNAPLLGRGVGLGTVAGARLMTGTNTFLLSESEWSRIVLELGPPLGFAFILWRLWLAVLMVIRGWGNFLATGDALSWVLAGATFLSVVNGQWGPSTNLGFAVFGAGLSLAALNQPEDTDVEEDLESVQEGAESAEDATVA